MKLLARHDIQKMDYMEGSNACERVEGSLKFLVHDNRIEVDFIAIKSQPVDMIRGDYHTPHTFEYGNATWSMDELTLWNSEMEMITLEDAGINENDLITYIKQL